LTKNILKTSRQYFFKKLGINLDFFDIEELAMFRGLTEKPNRPICLINIDKTNVNISIFDNKGLHYYKSINNIDLGSKEIKTSIDYFKNRTGQRIKNIVLIGNTDFGKRITSELNLNIFIGKSVLYKANLPEKYIISIGAAFRGLDKRWDRDPSFGLQKIDKESKKEEVEIIESIVKEKKPRKKIKLKILFFVILIIIILLIILFFKPKDNQKIEEQETNQEINLPVEEQEIIEQINEVLIKETETGWLNVRQGAGTNYSIITKIYPGESYELLEETEEWYKIKIGDKEGWIFNSYAIKK